MTRAMGFTAITASRVSLARVFSGTITADTLLHVSGHGAAERGHPDHDADEKGATLLGPTLAPITSAFAGEASAVEPGREVCLDRAFV